MWQQAQILRHCPIGVTWGWVSTLTPPVYTSMMVIAWPRKTMCTNNAATCASVHASRRDDHAYTYPHKRGAEHEHHHKIGRPIAERALLQRSTVAIREYHVEQKAKAECAKEAEACHQSPHLQSGTHVCTSPLAPTCMCTKMSVGL